SSRSSSSGRPTGRAARSWSTRFRVRPAAEGRMGQFDGRVAIVTGAGSGLGRATAMQLAAEGASVACLDIVTDNVEKTAAEIGGGARAYTADVSDPKSVRTAVDGAASDLGRPGLVFNCAGIGRFS